MEKGAIFPLFYLPPIEFFSKAIEHKDNILIEDAEHFQKQTYRNRAAILSPNGQLDLIIPVIKGSKNHTHVRDVRISNDFRWQRLHWMSLQTCYRSSAFFEYYEDDFAVFYERKWEFLFDYNEQLLNTVFRLLNVSFAYHYTTAFEKSYDGYQDYRNSIHPKHAPTTPANAYFQVFESKTGFLPNLSIVDLLFNQGPQSKSYL